jgi:hypothetical protein
MDLMSAMFLCMGKSLIALMNVLLHLMLVGVISNPVNCTMSGKVKFG